MLLYMRPGDPHISIWPLGPYGLVQILVCLTLLEIGQILKLKKQVINPHFLKGKSLASRCQKMAPQPKKCVILSLKSGHLWHTKLRFWPICNKVRHMVFCIRPYGPKGYIDICGSPGLKYNSMSLGAKTVAFFSARICIKWRH